MKSDFLRRVTRIALADVALRLGGMDADEAAVEALREELGLNRPVYVQYGDWLWSALQGDFGKPRPALVIQADPFDELATVTVLPITSTLVEAPLIRIKVEPSPDNGLQKASQVMVDKAITVKRDKVGGAFGRVDTGTMIQVERCLAVFLGIAK